MSPRDRAAIRVAATLCLLGVAASAQIGAPPFSRSAWIRAQRGWARFDGGAEPATERSRIAIAESQAAGRRQRRPRGTPDGPPNLRVSDDILEADRRSVAQPETEAEPSLAANPADERHLVAGYQEDRFEDGGARALTVAVSFDTGRTWQESLLPGLTTAAGGSFDRASDPWLAFGTEGRVYYATIAFDQTRPDNAVTVSASEDGGLTWSAPAIVHINRNQDFDDKEAVVADTVADSPFAGRVYVAWDTVTGDRRQILRVAHSDDGGRRWSAPVDVSDQGANLGAIPLVGPGGVLHVVWMSYFTQRVEIRAARSEDGGATWSAPALVAASTTRSVESLRTGELVAAAIDPRSGRLHAVWPDQRFTPGTDQIALAVSNDGISWSAPLRVSDGPDDAPSFTPAIAVNGQGKFGIAYSTLRNDPARRFLVDQYFVTTNSRGRLLGATRSSTRSFDVRDAAVARGYFLGDYQGLVAGQRAFRAVWVSTNEGSRLRDGKQPDVVTLVVP